MSQHQDLQLLDNTFTFINTGTYSTVEEAIECGAAYVSDDITALESYTDGFKIPLYDLQDTLNAYSKCLGHSDISGFLRTEFFKVVVRFSRFMLLPEPARFPAPDSNLLAL